MNNLSEETSACLSRILMAGTKDGTLNWQQLSPVCVHVTIGDYGIFLTRSQGVVSTDIYYSNHTHLSGIPREGLRGVFNEAMAQVLRKRKMTAGEMIEMNSMIVSRLCREKNFLADIRKLLNQP